MHVIIAFFLESLAFVNWLTNVDFLGRIIRQDAFSFSKLSTNGSASKLVAPIKLAMCVQFKKNDCPTVNSNTILNLINKKSLTVRDEGK